MNYYEEKGDFLKYLRKTMRIMRLSLFLIILSTAMAFSATSYSQNVKLTVDLNNATVKEVIKAIENQSEFLFFYQEKHVDLSRQVTIHVNEKDVETILNQLFAGTNNIYVISDRQIVLGIAPRKELERQAFRLNENMKPVIEQPQQKEITGKVTDTRGLPVPGVSIIVKGTTIGTVTNGNGEFSLSIPLNAEILQFSFVGMKTQEVAIESRTTFTVVLEEDFVGIEEVVAIGYGTMRKSDLTGAVNRANIESFQDQPNVSIAQSLQGSVAGLNVGAVNRAGQEPSISIRGRTSISGAQSPLIVIDGVIYRGNLIDLNPNDIGSIDILKDNSAAAVYGSQASNGVILITTRMGKEGKGKPVFSYSGSYAMQEPINELIPLTGEDWIDRIVSIDWRNSRTAESGYIEPNPDYIVTTNFKDTDQRLNYEAGKETDWDRIVTNPNMYSQNHNLSMSSRTEFLNYFISFGFSDVKGYMKNEDYKRYNARINVDNHIANWLVIGMQSSFTLSDYSGEPLSPSTRFLPPYMAAYKENGELNMPFPHWHSIAGLGTDDNNTRNNLFGNIYADISIPFIPGLSYKINFSNNLINNQHFNFNPFSGNMQGRGSKIHSINHNMLSDNILTYNRTLKERHKVNVTLLYGFEKRNFTMTRAQAQNFANPVLGYNQLQAGSSELQQAISGAWEESSLYSMGRIAYTLFDRYLFTGTVRRDGFSGFSEKNKFGVFPSLALGWLLSEEPFMKEVTALNYLKLRVSYGSTGNRTVGRYQTLARVSGGYNYINANEEPVFTQAITSLASPGLKWETTTGTNFGLDFGFSDSRILGSIEYYNNNTTDLLYNVDVPSISRYSNFPDNLGKIHNHGIELSLSTVNIRANNFRWRSDFVFSRSRDELVSLLGFDIDGDGIEDDLVSEGLFIGEPLRVIYNYETTGEMYQLGDEIPDWSEVGNFKIIDQNDDGKIDILNDYKILGYQDPSYRFSIANTFEYKNWTLYAFINTVQGGKNYYYMLDDDRETQGGFRSSSNTYNLNLAYSYNEWRPENPDAWYPAIVSSTSVAARRIVQRNFIRLQDVSLSYSVSPEVLNRINIESLRVFITGKNLITLTNWPGLDPETGDLLHMNKRPLLRSYSLGVNFEF